MKWIFHEIKLILTRGHRLPRLLLHPWSLKNEKLLRLLPYTVSQKLSERNICSKTFSTRMWVRASVFECARVFFGCNWSISNMCVWLRSVNFFRVCAQCCKQTNSFVFPTGAFIYALSKFLFWSSNDTLSILKLSNRRLSALGQILLC